METTLIQKLPVRFREVIRLEDLEGLEEIRFRVGWPMELYYGNQNIRLIGRICSGDVMELLNYLTGYSLYAYEEEMKQGYFTIEGGHRIGIVGRTSLNSTSTSGLVQVAGMMDISGVNIRVAHEKKGCGMELIPYIRRGEDIYNTLFLAKPGVGKTTYLRDCIRILSGGEDGGAQLKISVVDERSEIAACHLGIPQNDLGPRTDVLDNCPKKKGMQMLLRSMSPQIIAVDELGGEEDFRMLYEVLYSGSRILGTVHAESVEEILEKTCMKKLIGQSMIGRFILLQKDGKGKRSYSVYDRKLCQIC